MATRSLSVKRWAPAGVLLCLLAGLLVAPPAQAAASDVVISEIMYNPLSGLDSDEFLELANPGATAVDVSGWCFSGITLCFASGTSIASHGFLAVSPDPARFQSLYGRAADATYTGGLKNSGEAIQLKDASSALIDSVTYLDVAPWPVTPDGLGPSLELIDPSLNNDDPLNWAASTSAGGSTARAANSVARSGLGPRIVTVTATPSSPAVNQAVVVTASITGQTSALLRYRTDFGAEQTKALTPAGGDTYTATLPGAAAGHLIRYRIEATNAVTTTRSPRADDTIAYQGVVVQSGVASALPVLEWFIADADYNQIINNPTADITKSAVLAYAGTVYDNVLVNIRGAASQSAPKPNWKFELPHNHDLDMPGVLIEPVDEFAMQADWSDHSHGRPMLSWESYRRAGVVDEQLFPVRTQRNAQFWGLYTYVDLFDGTWRDREGYGDKQFFKASTGAFDPNRPLVEVRFEKKNPDDGDFAPLQALLNGLALNGNAERDYLLANADIPQMINYAAVTALVEHVDSSSKNFYLAQDPTTGRWSVIPWDLDHTFGAGCCKVNSTFVTPAEPGDKTSDLMVAILAVPAWRDMYFRRLQTLVDEILAPGLLEAVYDAKVGPAAPTATLDFAAWPHPAGMTYASQRTALFNALNNRRNDFANDARVPDAAPANPTIVINEIQHSPVAGDAAEFVELANPGNVAIDVSGWSIAGSIDLQVQPGTVILPHQTMTFVADDPTFRATYGSTVFVGGRYDGALPASGTLTLLRANGSTADGVTYGGAGWPNATGGPSLELTDPALDHANPASWHLSTGSGTPGAPLAGGVVVTVPSAPGIGTPVRGPAGTPLTATAVWTVPGSTGGSPITGYQVITLTMSSSAAGATVLSSTTSSLFAASARSHRFTLPNGNYRFQVVAVNAVGTSSPSARSANVVPR